MLVPIVFLMAFLAVLTGTLLENGDRAARIEEDAAVARYSDVTIADGVADFTHGLARFVQLHGTAGPWPTRVSRSAL